MLEKSHFDSEEDSETERINGSCVVEKLNFVVCFCPPAMCPTTMAAYGAAAVVVVGGGALTTAYLLGNGTITALQAACGGFSFLCGVSCFAGPFFLAVIAGLSRNGAPSNQKRFARYES